MAPVSSEELSRFIEERIPEFHEKKLAKLQELRLTDVLKRKNPYLFRAKGISAHRELVKSILDAFLSSQEEAVFGDFLEELALFVCARAFQGVKSSAEGIDLEFVRDGTRYLVSVKSGPNWGNSQQITRMREAFKKARKILERDKAAPIAAVNGCCYGREKKPHKGDYVKLCGQPFWELISGDPDLYLRIIEPLGSVASETSDEFQTEYGRAVDRFAEEFTEAYCDVRGQIDWERLVRFNSAQIVE